MELSLPSNNVKVEVFPGGTLFGKALKVTDTVKRCGSNRSQSGLDTTGVLTRQRFCLADFAGSMSWDK